MKLNRYPCQPIVHRLEVTIVSDDYCRMCPLIYSIDPAVHRLCVEVSRLDYVFIYNLPVVRWGYGSIGSIDAIVYLKL
jgi:hypothetical protein